MAAFLGNFRNVMIAGLVLAIIMIFAFGRVSPGGFNILFWQAVMRWIHVFFGVLWIGLLYYFNFVAARKTPEMPAELRPALSKYITPEALFWFRWGAAGTIVAGIGIALLHGADYAANVFTFGLAKRDVGPTGGFVLMSIGIYLAIIMFLNVWAVIWPNQKRVLGFVEADDATKAKAARIAGMASRINTLLSLPMLTAMAMYETFFGTGF
ncbi:MAG TPA: urate hydroxylase PuuD [Caulobacteraceae bacterium]